MKEIEKVDRFLEKSPLWTGESNFFPARALPFRIPKILHRWLDRKFRFMIYATVSKNK